MHLKPIIKLSIISKEAVFTSWMLFFYTVVFMLNTVYLVE